MRKGDRMVVAALCAVPGFTSACISLLALFEGAGGSAFDRWLLLVILLGGVFGGLLYGMRDRRLVLPGKNEDGSFNPGWLADCAFGMGGGFVIFLLLPGDFDKLTGWVWIKVFATALVGGYGGRGIIDRMLSQVQKQAEEATAHAKAATAKIETIVTQSDADNQGWNIVSRQLSSDQDARPTLDELTKGLAGASLSMLRQVFYEAQRIRSESWEHEKGRMERTIPVFRALISRDPERRFHRNFGQLGYALKDKEPPDLEEAEAMLTQAIASRDAFGEKGWLFCEWNRAIVRIRRDANSAKGKKSTATVRAAIEADLAASARDAFIKQQVIAKDALLQGWMKLNGVRV